MSSRVRPNLLISGTPGVGKSLLAARLGEQLAMAVINVGQFAKERECLGAWDETYQSHELEEDKLLVTLLERQLRIKRKLSCGSKVAVQHSQFGLPIVSRPGQSQGLLFKRRCDLLSRTLSPPLPQQGLRRRKALGVKYRASNQKIDCVAQV